MFISMPKFLGIGQYFKYYFFFLGGYMLYKYRYQLKFLYNKYFATLFVNLERVPNGVGKASVF